MYGSICAKLNEQLSQIFLTFLESRVDYICTKVNLIYLLPFLSTQYFFLMTTRLLRNTIYGKDFPNAKFDDIRNLKKLNYSFKAIGSFVFSLNHF